MQADWVLNDRVYMELAYYHSTNTELNVILEMTKWAKKHCPSYITNNLALKDGLAYYCFYFYDEKDYVWFKLTWQ